jgi:hypothetical protein
VLGRRAHDHADEVEEAFPVRDYGRVGSRNDCCDRGRGGAWSQMQRRLRDFVE